MSDTTEQQIIAAEAAAAVTKKATSRKRKVAELMDPNQEKPKRAAKKQKTPASSDSSDTVGTEEGLALNQQIWYAKVAYKPAVGETIVIAQKEGDVGEPYMVNTVSLVGPTHVPNDLVVECTVTKLDGSESVELKLLRSGDWVLKTQEHLKRKQRAQIKYQKKYAAAGEQ